MIDPNFIVIDLRAQRSAFKEYVAEWPLPEILSFLARYGHVVILEGTYNTMYLFESVSRLHAGFWLDDNGKLVIFG